MAGGAVWAFQVILFCVGVLQPAARPLHARLATFSSTPFCPGSQLFSASFHFPIFPCFFPLSYSVAFFSFCPAPILITTLMSLPESWPQTRWDQITGKGRCRPPTLAVGVLWGLSSTQAECVGDLFCSCCWEQAVPNPWQECNPWTRMPPPPPCPKHLLFLESHSCGWTFEWEWWVAQLLAFLFFVIHLTHTLTSIFCSDVRVRDQWGYKDHIVLELYHCRLPEKPVQMIRGCSLNWQCVSLRWKWAKHLLL